MSVIFSCAPWNGRSTHFTVVPGCWAWKSLISLLTYSSKVGFRARVAKVISPLTSPLILSPEAAPEPASSPLDRPQPLANRTAARAAAARARVRLMGVLHAGGM
jgi:hypothetical protein